MLPIDLGAYVLGAKSSMASHALQIIGKHHPWSHERDMKEILFKLSRPCGASRCISGVFKD
jgi:hypothetical protein